MMRKGNRARRGFNLIEAAIVLGVVGLVIGGIWVAASAVNENLKVSRTTSDILIISKNVQNLISRSDANGIGDGSDILGTLINASAFPENWVHGATAMHDFGGFVSIFNVTSGGVPRFQLHLYEVPKSSCIKLVTSLSVSAAATGSWTVMDANALIAIDVDGNQQTNFPISLSTAQGMCNSATTTTIRFEFGYTRN